MTRLRMAIIVSALTGALLSCASGDGTPVPAYSGSSYPDPTANSYACGALGTCPPSNYPRLGPHDGAMGF